MNCTMSSCLLRRNGILIDMENIRIRKDEKFHWLIRDGVDTTANPNNTNTYYLQALKVSDHYPVEVDLKSIVETDETNACPVENKLITDKKPKGKTSAYSFVRAFYEEHMKKHPGAKVILKEVTKMCSEKWKTMSPEEKAKFEEMAKNDKLRYDQEMKSYVPPAGAKKGKKKKKKKDPNAPKKPPSVFLIFASEHREKVKVDNPEISNTDISKKLGEMWTKMSTTDKAPYEAKYAKLMEKYEMEVAAYRAKGTKKAESADDEEDEDEEDDDDEDDGDEDENDVDEDDD
ncbi:high mobility group protein B2-like isoform X2 [Pelmatolapia mariae]|uniref:high mobility group protein B2-like isoform X2 n=1 Tax=Pelmatolapia mariae TaxID=158779 RepID=UPI002FE67E5F